MKTAILILTAFLFSGCASTIEFLDRQVQKSAAMNRGLVDSDGYFAPQSLPNSPILDAKNAENLAIRDRVAKQKSTPDAEIYAVDPVSGRAFKTGEIDFELPPGYMP